MLKKSVVLHGHTTSVSIEAPFWTGLKTIAHERKMSLNTLVAHIDAARLGDQGAWSLIRGELDIHAQRHLQLGNLSSSVRVYVYLVSREKSLS